MKSLLLMRHAEAEDGANFADEDRPLTEAGRRAARAIGRELRAIGLDTMLTSPAKRSVQTHAEVRNGYETWLYATTDMRAYLASPATLLEIVHGSDAEVGRLLVIGHNPGIAVLAGQLAGEPGLARRFAPGTVAVIAFAVDTWKEVQAGGGTLVRLIRAEDVEGAVKGN